MYSSTFIFAAKEFDTEFHRLDAIIAAAARDIPGYLGETSWENPQTGLVANVYYWDSLDALQALVRHPQHLEAKALARERGKVRMDLTTARSNQQAQALYESLGWQRDTVFLAYSRRIGG